MEKYVNIPDRCGRHLAPYRRGYPLLPQVESIGYMRRKTERIALTFGSCNYSFILSGRGDYILDGRKYRVEAPCVLLQWPGQPQNYGPASGETWEELFLIYPAGAEAMLTASQTFLEGAKPVRPFLRTALFEEALSGCMGLLESREASADYADLCCWNLVMGSSLMQPAPAPDPRWKIINEYLTSDFAHETGLAEIARKLGMSVSTLQRFWRQSNGGVSVRKYRNNLFLREASRMLVETRLPIKSIAARLGFDDPYYFSRKYHQLCQETPTSYRSKHAVSML
jgi:AraC-like DNA-binding protein